jgi:hypothetical protein
MATDAQIGANRMNAQASTGAVMADGKSRVSRNALTFGPYSSGDFVRPEEERDQYSEFCTGFQTDLAPEGAIEQTLTAEIIHAAWRLRRCSVIEGGMKPIGRSAKKSSTRSSTRHSWRSIMPALRPPGSSIAPPPRFAASSRAPVRFIPGTVFYKAKPIRLAPCRPERLMQLRIRDQVQTFLR